MKNALIGLIASLALFGLAHADDGEAYAVRCQDTGKNSKQCQVTNTGRVEMEVCMDVVKVCSDGDHVAPMCSGRIAPGQSEPVVVKNFTPKVRLLVSCQGTEFRNKYFHH
jgi:hypothetical protein